MEDRTFDYRFPEQILENQQFQQIKWEIFDIVKRAFVVKLLESKIRK